MKEYFEMKLPEFILRHFGVIGILFTIFFTEWILFRAKQIVESTNSTSKLNILSYVKEIHLSDIFIFTVIFSIFILVDRFMIKSKLNSKKIDTKRKMNLEDDDDIKELFHKVNYMNKEGRK